MITLSPPPLSCGLNQQTLSVILGLSGRLNYASYLQMTLMDEALQAVGTAGPLYASHM